MSRDPFAAIKSHLLTQHLADWAPVALHRSRRATFVQAYAGPDTQLAEVAVRAAAEPVARGDRLALVVLATVPGDLATRLGTVEAQLPAEVSVHLIPGGPGHLPISIKAAEAAGAPLLVYLDSAEGPTPDSRLLASVAAVRPGEVLLTAPGGTGWDARTVLHAAGFPLVTQIDLATRPTGPRFDGRYGTHPPAVGDVEQVIAFGTGSDRSLSALKDALWSAPTATDLCYRDPRGQLREMSEGGDEQMLASGLLHQLRQRGPATVTELRRFTLTDTPWRAADTRGALDLMLDAGVVTRDPAVGRLGGDVVIAPVAG